MLRCTSLRAGRVAYPAGKHVTILRFSVYVTTRVSGPGIVWLGRRRRGYPGVRAPTLERIIYTRHASKPHESAPSDVP